MTSLSKSTLWCSMQDYYNHMGPEAWVNEIVPFQITNNIALAKLYTQLITAQINDYITKHGKEALTEPFHIIEIGAGSGKFSFYLIKTLCAALKTFNLSEKTILYVMTDISEKNIFSWKKHPKLQPYANKNILDFAYYDAIKDDKLHLTNKTIEINSLTKPMFVICNYIIDTLPHDAFQISNSKLYETELLIQNTSNDKTVEQYFNNLTFKFNKNPINKNYYDKQVLNQILSFYQDYFENASFLMPVGGMQLLDNISKLTNNHTVLLVADKGITELSLFNGLDNPDISLHGSVSMTVNFDALSRYVNMQKGTSLLMPNKSADFQIGCFILNSSFSIPHTTFTFNTTLSFFSLFDLFNLCYKEDEQNKAFTTVEDLLAILNLAEWDPNIFYDYHSILLECLECEEITEEQKLMIVYGLDKVWEYFFKLEKAQDIPFAIGMLLYNVEESEKALIYYKHSLDLFGEQEETLYNIALAYQQLEDESNMTAAANKAININPDYEPAKELLTK